MDLTPTPNDVFLISAEYSVTSVNVFAAMIHNNCGTMLSIEGDNLLDWIKAALLHKVDCPH